MYYSAEAKPKTGECIKLHVASDIARSINLLTYLLRLLTFETQNENNFLGRGSAPSRHSFRLPCHISPPYIIGACGDSILARWALDLAP